MEKKNYVPTKYFIGIFIILKNYSDVTNPHFLDRTESDSNLQFFLKKNCTEPNRTFQKLKNSNSI